MSSKKHTESVIDLAKPYEPNDLGLKGIVGFAIGLLLLILITFGLMWAFQNVMRDYSKELAGPGNPMLMSEKERLAPEPRLQLAPGFGVESEKGRVNLELLTPQAEYRELKSQWDRLWKYGRKDKATGLVTILPIDEAKSKVLQQGLKAKADDAAMKIVAESNEIVSDASSGRLAGATRR